jgi:hypothetical protein
MAVSALPPNAQSPLPAPTRFDSDQRGEVFYQRLQRRDLAALQSFCDDFSDF